MDGWMRIHAIQDAVSCAPRNARSAFSPLRRTHTQNRTDAQQYQHPLATGEFVNELDPLPSVMAPKRLSFSSSRAVKNLSIFAPDNGVVVLLCSGPGGGTGFKQQQQQCLNALYWRVGCSRPSTPRSYPHPPTTHMSHCSS